ncbi:MAG: Yip1 family protein [Bacillota bacterium]
MKQFLEKLSYTKHVIVNPFDGYYEIKFRNKGDALIATLFFLINSVLAVVSTQYNGFVINTFNIKNMNSLLIMFYSLFPYLIFVVGNYSTTTLFDGKGTMREIYIVVGYALFPYIVSQVIGVIFSQFITMEEVPIYRLIVFAGSAWFAFLVFSGLIVVHEYGVLKNIATLLCTVLAVSIVLFLCLLTYSLIQEVLAFVQLFITEAIVRIEGWSS